MKKFNIFGLNILSEIDLKTTEVTFETHDVEIVFGIVPETLENLIVDTKKVKSNNHQMIYNVKTIARYLIEDGSKITIEPVEGSSTNTIKLYLDGLAFSGVLAQRGVISLHGSTIKMGDKCILIMGDSGAGKSSLTTGLLDKGYELITDDVIVLREHHNRLMVYPGFPEQKLFKELVERYNLHEIVDEMVYYPGVKTEKYHINRNQNFYRLPCDVTTIVHLKQSENELSIKEVKGIEKLDVVLKNTYRSHFLNYFKKEKNQFEICTKLSNTCSVYILKRPYNTFTVDEQVNMLINEIRG